MLPILQLGPLALQTPGLILLAGLWLGLAVSERYADRFGVRPEQIYNLTFVMLIAGIIGARLSIVVQFPAVFIESPPSLISLNPALLDPIGGMLIASIFGLLYLNTKGMKIAPTLDALTPAMAVLAIAYALSNLASGAAFGLPTEMPWGIYLWQEFRHPTQIYQALLQGLILWAIWPKPNHAKHPTGRSFLTWLSLSAGATIIIESFRADSILLVAGLRQAQVLAWFVLAFSLFAHNQMQAGQSAIE